MKIRDAKRWLGSPPLTRGQRSAVDLDCVDLGITPAHAGTTEPWDAWPGCSWDHPRSRGDNAHGRHCSSSHPGSPPLTRGQRPWDYLPLTVFRITPAHAGTTPSSSCQTSSGRDHPRSRGDNWQRMHFGMEQLGSPPLTRGQLRYDDVILLEYRITPAHAGTTQKRHNFDAALQDHPRSRGDNFHYVQIPCKGIGSPPLTRGQRAQDKRVKAGLGITPAHAGTTMNK